MLLVHRVGLSACATDAANYCVSLASDYDADEEDDEAGCSVASPDETSPVWMLITFGLLLARRRKSAL